LPADMSDPLLAAILRPYPKTLAEPVT
jgi:hypothetical protein